MPPETDNLQLEEVFKEDQADREKVYETPESVQQLRERDRQRRKRIYMMIDLGEVRTKNDLYHASVILQHGEEPSDFLTSHRLASIAAIMGHRTARWLMAASLDRYLMSEKLPQLYGTQFQYNPESHQYELRLPIHDHAMLGFEKEFLGVPQISMRLKELNKRIEKKT
ncbi:MAG: hypothetical protein HY078_03435 [Elusimicrobia bacterium]|nr:hypothetical protein [Elusimicrobiota bacterium]